jgi:HSP20 family protein
MSIVVKKDQEQNLEAARTEWHPLRLMRDLLRWDPFAEMTPVMPMNLRLPEFAPSFEVKETKEAYVFTADLPGVADKDLEVTLAGRRLAVTGKREGEKEEKEDKYYAYERTYGAFTRAFTLPDGADTDHIAAELKQGVLTVVVPKRAEIQAKKIAVKNEKTRA